MFFIEMRLLLGILMIMLYFLLSFLNMFVWEVLEKVEFIIDLMVWAFMLYLLVFCFKIFSCNCGCDLFVFVW